LAHFEFDTIRHLARSGETTATRKTAAKERVSDCWPDFGTALKDFELASAEAKNRPGTVLLQAMGAVIYSVGLVVLLMTVQHLR
jgi:hypothetical protein